MDVKMKNSDLEKCGLIFDIFFSEYFTFSDFSVTSPTDLENKQVTK